MTSPQDFKDSHTGQSQEAEESQSSGDDFDDEVRSPLVKSEYGPRLHDVPSSARGFEPAPDHQVKTVYGHVEIGVPTVAANLAHLDQLYRLEATNTVPSFHGGFVPPHGTVPGPAPQVRPTHPARIEGPAQLQPTPPYNQGFAPRTGNAVPNFHNVYPHSPATVQAPVHQRSFGYQGIRENLPRLQPPEPSGNRAIQTALTHGTARPFAAKDRAFMNARRQSESAQSEALRVVAQNMTSLVEEVRKIAEEGKRSESAAFRIPSSDGLPATSFLAFLLALQGKDVTQEEWDELVRGAKTTLDIEDGAPLIRTQSMKRRKSHYDLDMGGG